ncbi:MAG: hypothetical protein SZ59_C0002G0327 [candidate division TM6 bacterium GW2011_GWF2_28_16]|nr:MAG: hypothetical protein SZ59_C0002G0327 [candidate division TM6 bacterium GW2011_GWF2_28_16]
MLNKIKENFFKNFLTQNNNLFNYQIGPHTIKLPGNHALKNYQEVFKRYDIALGEITKIINNKYPDLTVIDIGANIGDSAALISKYRKIPTLCIEGNENFLPTLKENAKTIGTHIFIEECFVGKDNTILDINKIETKRGTANINKAIKNNKLHDTVSDIAMQSLETILNKYTNFRNSKLIKIDTDGYDFEIIKNSQEIINQLKPVIFFEYDPSMAQNGEQESINTINSLVNSGYKQFIIYDNFGNYLLSLDNKNISNFVDLNSYLRSNKKYKQIVYYFDICAFHENDLDLFEKVKEHEINLTIL